MKIIHTSDWHIGAVLKNRRRYPEHGKTLEWLAEICREKQVRAVIAAGDIFDSRLPSNTAAELYYSFLLNAASAGVRDIIVTAGNHDSVQFLEAPLGLLKKLNVHVAARVPENLKDLLIPLYEDDGSPTAVVCALPYLRDSDLRLHVIPGETLTEQEARRHDAIAELYRNAVQIAKAEYPQLPLLTTGHFYATGGKVSQGLRVGNSPDIGVCELQQEIDYLALGHLHTEQPVGGFVSRRYSGSLLRMDFSESGEQKKVLLLESSALSAEPEKIPVPVFQDMVSIRGDLESLRSSLEEWKTKNIPVWIRAENTGCFEPRLQNILNSICEKSSVEIFSAVNTMPNPALAETVKAQSGKKLSDLTPEEVFLRLLEQSGIAGERQEQLLQAFRTAEKIAGEQDT